VLARVSVRIMPPRRAVRVRIAMKSVEEQELSNALDVQTQEEIKYADRREAIRILSQVATYHVGQRDNRHEVVDTSRIRELLRMNPPSFSGSSISENLENFIEELKRIFDVMHVAESERVELAAYQLKGVARIWFDRWKQNRAEDAPVVSWVVFESALMGRFFPRELREAKIKEFLTLNPESMSVHEYSLKFTQLSRYASEMVADMRSRMSLYVAGLSRKSSKESKAAMLIGDIDLARFMIHLQQVEEDKLKDREEFNNKRAKIVGEEFKQQKNDANQSSLPQKQKRPVPPSASVPALENKDGYNRNSYNFRARLAYPQGSVVLRGSKALTCARCGRTHPGKCRQGQKGCFKCGQEGHVLKECPKSRQGSGNLGSKAQSSSVVPPDRMTPRGATSSTCGGANCLYAINSRQEQEDSPDVVTGMILVFDFAIYALLDPRASLSFEIP